MPRDNPDAFQLACDFAPEAETILGVSGIVEELDQLSGKPEATQKAQDRAVDLGDIGSIAGALISLFMWIDQIRMGEILKGASRGEIIQDLIHRVLDSHSLTPEAKERLVSRALDWFFAKRD